MNKSIIIETERLILHRLVQTDFDNLRNILRDEEVMYAYEGTFDDTEVQEWLDRQINRYENDGIGLYAVTLKASSEFIGQCGLTMQDYNNSKVMEVGYLFRKEFWHQGYATEAAIACKEYAFNKLGVDKIYSIIRNTNTASQKVAERNGMVMIDQFVKHFKGVEMPHFVFLVKKEDYEK